MRTSLTLYFLMRGLFKYTCRITKTFRVDLSVYDDKCTIFYRRIKKNVKIYLYILFLRMVEEEENKMCIFPIFIGAELFYLMRLF
jgi:hypothetical protein